MEEMSLHRSDHKRKESLEVDHFSKNIEDNESLETKSEPEIPVRPPRPRKSEKKVQKNLSLNEIDLHCQVNQRPFDEHYYTVMRSAPNTETAEKDQENIKFDITGKVNDEQVSVSDSDGLNSVLQTGNRRSPREEDVTDIDSRSSIMSESSTLSTEDEMDFDASRLSAVRNSLSENDDSTLIYYREAEDSLDTRIHGADETKQQSKEFYGGGSDYVRVYPVTENQNNTASRETNFSIVGGVQMKEIDEEIGTGNEIVKEEKPHELNGQRLSVCQTASKSGTNSVQVDVPVRPEVQHIDLHFHINFSFSHQPLCNSQQPVHFVTRNLDEESGSLHMRSESSKKSKNSKYTNTAISLAAEAERATELPNPPPKPKKRDIRGRNKVKNSQTSPAKLAESTVKSKGSFWMWNLRKSKIWESIPFKKDPRDYDEIDLNDQVKTTKETSNGTDQEENTQSMPLEQEKDPFPWLYTHNKRKQAEESLKAEKNGSFVVIEEDADMMPYTPYTLLLVREGRLIQIPVIKHKTFPFIKHGTLLAKEAYSLATSPGHKLKSIEDIVAYYLKHEISGIKLKLNQRPDTKNQDSYAFIVNKSKQ